MKPRTLLLLSGVVGLAYLVWRTALGKSAAAGVTGGIKPARVNDLSVLPVRRSGVLDPIGSPPNKGIEPILDYNPYAGDLGPPVEIDMNFQRDLVADAHLASGLPDTPREDPGTNVPVGVTSPFMRRPLEWLNNAS